MCMGVFITQIVSLIWVIDDDTTSYSVRGLKDS